MTPKFSDTYLSAPSRTLTPPTLSSLHATSEPHWERKRTPGLLTAASLL